MNDTHARKKLRSDGDPYIGIEVNGYVLKKKVDEGKIGSVYRACARSNPKDIVACKVIPEGKLKRGWERELQKVVLLRTVPNVIQYYAHGSAFDLSQRPFTWVLWNYVHGINLGKYLRETPWPLDMAFIENLTRTLLEVLHACRAVGLPHGDLHPGNILISEPDRRLHGQPRRIWVSDFGYGGSHNEVEPKDDYRQVCSIISTLLGRLNKSELTARDRVMHEKLGDFLRKRVLEADATQGAHSGKPETLLAEFSALAPRAESESAVGGSDYRELGDYLWAEALGYRAEEWRQLFVPEFLAAEGLLSRNITILTGARGCGKTMAFRRLTAFMDSVTGQSSGVVGADQFVGFYLNCRNLVEAFPWVPRRLSPAMEQQIMHYFHLAWFAEVCRTLAIRDQNRTGTYDWLDGFLVGVFGVKYHLLPHGADVLTHVQAFVDDEKENCRITDLGRLCGISHWPLARIDFLDRLQSQLETHVPWINRKPLYFFLDDYTIPIVTREVQRILNQIIFKRRSSLFFKVSTEAAISFERRGMHGKPLELGQDFELVDLATESLHQRTRDKIDLLDKIFRPRLNRHPVLQGKNLGLREVLGESPCSNNELAWQMRQAVQGGRQTRILYHGVDSFVGLWASDTRVMIQMVVEMLRDANGALKRGEYQVDRMIQDRCYRTKGGEFLVFTESVSNPALWEKGPSSTKPGVNYGRHLRDVAEAFVAVARYELSKGQLVSNQGQMNPKQAFRLEIVDKCDPPDGVVEYYEGLIRWHIFLQDWRGKSVRGMITPRLYLNRILIPFVNLTFSSHDNIPLTNKEFARLLKQPSRFLKYWRRKRRNVEQERSIATRANEEGPTLWDLRDDKKRSENR